MKKWILRLLAVIVVLCVGTMGWFVWTFKTQYEAAESIHLVQEGMYEYYYEGDDGIDELLDQGGAKSNTEIAVYATKFLTHGFAHLNISEQKFGCSSITAAGQNGHYLSARNFDWQDDQNDIVIIHNRPKNGYASVSTFNIGFFGFGDDFKPESMQQRFMTLGSIYVSLDGMNEKGLYVADLVAGDSEETHQQSAHPHATTSLSIRILLNKAADVEEALDLLAKLNMHSDIHLSHHLSISDANGRCVVVEWVDNKMYVAESPICTNHYLAESPKSLTQQISNNSQMRFDLLQEHYLTHPTMSVQDITEAISSVAGPNYTRWTIVYDREHMTATYYQYADFTKPYTTKIAD